MKKIVFIFVIIALVVGAYFTYLNLDKLPVSAEVKYQIRSLVSQSHLDQVDVNIPKVISSSEILNKNEKTMVRYKDNKGHWQFADKAPAGATNISEIKVRTDMNNFSKDEYSATPDEEANTDVKNSSLSNGLRDSLDLN